MNLQFDEVLRIPARLAKTFAKKRIIQHITRERWIIDGYLRERWAGPELTGMMHSCARSAICATPPSPLALIPTGIALDMPGVALLCLVAYQGNKKHVVKLRDNLPEEEGNGSWTTEHISPY